MTMWFVCRAPFLLLSLSLGSKAKVGRERGGHGPKTALKPQPLFEWGCLLVHYWAFPSSCKQKRGMWKCILDSFLSRLYFSSAPPPYCLLVNAILILTKKQKQTLRYFSFLIIFLFRPWCSSLYLSLPLFMSALLHSLYCHLPHCTRV